MSAVTAPIAAAGLSEQRNFRAYVQDDETRKVIDEVVGDLMIPSATVQKGGIAEAIQQLGVQRSPKVLIVDMSGSDMPLSDVNELAEVCEPGTTVIAIGDRNDVGLFRDLINNGISDYLVKPITPSLLQKSLLNVSNSSPSTRHNQRLGRLIAVTGTRGGVGATMLATNMAWTIATRRRRRVALVDLDLQFGTVALALDMEPSHGLREALENPSRVDGLFVDRAMVKHSDTLYVMSSEESLSEPFVPDPLALDVLLKELRSKFHYVIVDVPRHVSPCTQQLMQTASNAVLVSDLSLAGMRDALRQIAVLPAVNASCQITLVINRAGEFPDGEISRREFEAAVGRNIDFVIPFSAKSVMTSSNMGQPVAAGRNNVAAGIQQVTDRLTGAGSPRKSSRYSFWPFSAR